MSQNKEKSPNKSSGRSVEDLFKELTPEYEERAGVFMQEITLLANNYFGKSEIRSHEITDAILLFMDGYDALPDNPSMEEVYQRYGYPTATSKQISRALEIMSATRSVIQVFTTSDNFKFLQEFTSHVFDISKEYSASIDEDIFPLVNTGENKDLISNRQPIDIFQSMYAYEKIEPRYHSRLFFTFTTGQTPTPSTPKS